MLASIDVKSSQVKCIYKAHLKTAHADQSAVQLNHNKIEKQIEKQKKKQLDHKKTRLALHAASIEKWHMVI